MIDRSIFSVFVLGFVLVAGCTEDPIFPSQSVGVTAVDLPQLEGDANYELWLSYPEGSAADKGHHIDHGETEYFSVGRFIVDQSGALRSPDDSGPASFAIPAGYNPSLVGQALVSVEKRGDNDGVPDAYFLWSAVTGDADRGIAQLIAGTSRTFDSLALTGVNGTFVLEAPTSSAPGDQLSGIWFVKHERNGTTGDSISPSTNLRTLPLAHDNDRWTYEAWLTERRDGGISYRSLGRFRSPSAADSNRAGSEAGPLLSGAYPFPGEDFVQSGRRLADSVYGVVISLQPEDIALDAPLLRVLERTSIGVDAVSKRDIYMVTPQTTPVLEVVIDR